MNRYKIQTIRLMIFIMFMASGTPAAGQYLFAGAGGPENHGRYGHSGPDCDTRIQRADSVTSYSYNPLTGIFTPAEMIHYSYDSRNNLTVIHRMTLPGRNNIIKQVFEYNRHDKQVRYTNYLPSENGWEPSLIVTKQYDGRKRITTEIFHHKDGEGNFTPYMRHFYSYKGGLIAGYLRQMKNSSGEWYDFSNHFYEYDAWGRLTLLYGKYINGPVYWERTSVYDSDGQLTQRYLRQLKYDPAAGQNILANITFESYSRNIFGNISEILYHGWNGTGWELNGKAVYHYSFLKGRKVAVCHKGRTLYLPADAVEARLRHGDSLGPCSCGQQEEKATFTIYPNPASDHITIRFSDNGIRYTGGALISHDGRMLQRFRYNGEGQTMLDISGLRNGTYYLIMYRPDGGSDSQSLIKK